jgi:hypothetical protein
MHRKQDDDRVIESRTVTIDRKQVNDRIIESRTVTEGQKDRERVGGPSMTLRQKIMKVLP